MKIPKLKEWVPFKKTMCKTCWATCCHKMQVEAGVKDMIRMGVLTEIEAITSMSTAVTRLKKEGIIRAYKKKEFVFVLAQRRNGDCVFLDEKRRCSIYPTRPEICRQFPKMSPKPGHCPYRPKTAS